MSYVEEGTLLWEPTNERINQSNLQKYMNWLKTEKDLNFTDYSSLWTWSVDEVEAFWESLWEYFNIIYEKPYKTVLTERKMPGAKWFKEATIKYTEHIFRQANDQPAIIYAAERRQTTEIPWEKLYQDTAAFQKTLKSLDVQKGDRVVAYVANIYETVVSFLATASLGAIWSSASPDFGTESVIDRFTQIEPKVMITVDGYTYEGREFDRLDVAKSIQDQLPTLEATIVIPFLHEQPKIDQLKQPILFSDAIKSTEKLTLEYEYINFNDPLWVLFSSGTTGRPKPIVQSQGGILLEHLKAITFHVDLKQGDRFFWYTTTGWMMWHVIVGGVPSGATIIHYAGSPGYANRERLWQLAEETKMTIFGTSASYIIDSMNHGVNPGEKYDLSHLSSVSSTGSPLPPEGFVWCYENIKKDLWIASISGGTDVCTAFILGAPILPVYAGELQCRGLGAKIESFTFDGKSVINEVGELVLTEPLPSMPIYFWNDDDGTRLHESYFDMFPGIWRHGDYLKITDRETCVIYGRSDATINRGGIRIGTSEIYRAVDHVDIVTDSLIVDIPIDNSESIVPLFVTMKDDAPLTDETKQEIIKHIRTYCSHDMRLLIFTKSMIYQKH